MEIQRYHKESDPVKTAKMWPWKSESSKNSVTTYLPNRVASKIDVAKISFRYIARARTRTTTSALSVDRCGDWS